MEAKILVTGASGGTQGATGNRLTQGLLEKGAAVRAFVRREDARSARLKAAGAEIFTGDLRDFRAVRQAVKGIDRVYFCYPVRAGLLDATTAMAEAAKEEGVKFVLNLSQGASSDTSPSPHARRHWLSEKIFDRSGIPTFHLRGAVFYENLFRQFADGIRDASELRAPFGTGDGKIPAIAARDIVRVALIAIEDPAAFAGKTHLVLGSALSLNEIAQELTDLLGRRVRYREISPEDWVREAEAREGTGSPEQIEHLVNLWKAILILNQNASMVQALQELARLFEKLTGERPLAWHEWLKRDEATIKAAADGHALTSR